MFQSVGSGQFCIMLSKKASSSCLFILFVSVASDFFFWA